MEFDIIFNQDGKIIYVIISFDMSDMRYGSRCISSYPLSYWQSLPLDKEFITSDCIVYTVSDILDDFRFGRVTIMEANDQRNTLE